VGAITCSLCSFAIVLSANQVAGDGIKRVAITSRRPRHTAAPAKPRGPLEEETDAPGQPSAAGPPVAPRGVG